MRERDFRQNVPGSLRAGHGHAEQELPVGSELMIAFSLGIVGWWGIAQMVMWIAG